MPYVTASDGIQLYFEETGAGTPLVLVHEFAGDYRSWEPQVRALARRFRVIAYNARGYPPSDAPADVAHYSQQRAVDDIRDVVEGLGLAPAHVCGISMGGYATLHFAIQRPDLVRSIVVAGCGYGSTPGDRAKFQQDVEATASQMEREGMRTVASWYSKGPTRVQFENKDPRGFREFAEQLAEHSDIGAANTFRGIQRERPSIFELEAPLRALSAPTLVIVGDEDDPCLEPALFMKRTIRGAGLVVVPNTGHTVNLEEPEAFNQAVLDFLTAVESGRWPNRDPRSQSGSAILPPERDK